MSAYVKPSAHADRRRFGRRESCIHAMAIVPSRGAMPCTVVNISERGALLQFAEAFPEIPIFRLIVDTRHLDVMCEVRHRGEHGIGVLFDRTADSTTIDRLAEASPAPVAKPVRKQTSAELRRAVFGPAPKRVV